jgi:hypothetical protein
MQPCAGQPLDVVGSFALPSKATWSALLGLETK